jgi:hypothetical protein
MIKKLTPLAVFGKYIFGLIVVLGQLGIMFSVQAASCVAPQVLQNNSA